MEFRAVWNHYYSNIKEGTVPVANGMGIEREHMARGEQFNVYGENVCSQKSREVEGCDIFCDKVSKIQNIVQYIFPRNNVSWRSELNKGFIYAPSTRSIECIS